MDGWMDGRTDGRMDGWKYENATVFFDSRKYQKHHIFWLLYIERFLILVPIMSIVFHSKP